MGAQENLWYIPLVVPLLAGIMSFFGTLLASFYSRQTEQQKWLRQEQLKAYSAYYAVMDEFFLFTAMNHDRDPFENVADERHGEYLSLLRDGSKALGLIDMLGTGAVVDSAHDVWKSVVGVKFPLPEDGKGFAGKYLAAQTEFAGAARRELGVKHRGYVRPYVGSDTTAPSDSG